MFTLVTRDFRIVGRWRAVCVTALQRPNSDAAAIGIVVGIAAASLSVTKAYYFSDYVPYVSLTEIERNLQFPRFVKAQSQQNVKTLNAELEVLKQELEIQKLKRRIKTSVTQRAKPQLEILHPMEMNKPDTPNLGRHFSILSHGLEPAPYDPISGFVVVFYDYLLGLDPSYRVCRLVVSLCSGGQEMGNPSTLPPVYCDASLSKLYESKKQNMAILSTKQAVPRVRPSPNISLIIELQASGGYDPYGQEVSRLIPRGWVKVDIFDYQNRVISGQWKIPIRILPLKPSLTTGALNGVPQLENAELFIRLVNARDADIQSTYSINISNSIYYKYPPLASDLGLETVTGLLDIQLYDLSLSAP
ncbi:unnamed protein product [Ranitomeya imitator]|uniref:Uncharacterized protein n=1 Tax=Ranitomeya imitator TaxID=111125 RepID=A0ABN9KWK9_9NEOB|nr:unnamed protein product [Ranitomeya imitator]